MSRIEKRVQYIKRIVSEAPKTQRAVEKLAKELFISERTIYRDLAR